VFFPFFYMASFAIFLNFLWWNLPKFSQHISFCGISNKKSRVCKGSFFNFQKFISFTAAKNWSYRFPWKMSPDLSKIFTTSLPNFTEFHWRNVRKFIASSAFCAHVDIIKYRKKHWHFPSSVHRILELRSCDHKTIGSHLNNSKKLCH